MNLLGILLVSVFASAGTAEARTIDQARRDAIVWLEGDQNADGSRRAGRLQASVGAERLFTRGGVSVFRVEVTPQ